MAHSSLPHCIRLVFLEVSRATERFNYYPAWLSRPVTPATTIINEGAHQRNANSCMEFGEVWEEPFIVQGSSLRAWEGHMAKEREKCVPDQLFYFRPFPQPISNPTLVTKGERKKKIKKERKKKKSCRLPGFQPLGLVYFTKSSMRILMCCTEGIQSPFFTH